MERPGFTVVRFGDDHSYSDIATRRLFGDSANVVVLKNFDACLEAASADRGTAAMVPVYNTANKRIQCADRVPVADRAEDMGLRVLATLELPVDHVLASFGSIDEIATVYSKDEALEQCSKIIKDHGWRRLSTVTGSRVALSTSGAARYVAGKRNPSIAAICSEPAAKFHGVPVVQRDIADSLDNRTVFHAYVRADSEIPAPGPRGQGAPGRREARRGPPPPGQAPAGAPGARAASACAASHGQARARDPRTVGSPQHMPAPPMAAQAAAESPLELAAIETKRYAARIVKDPKACPMFPVVNEGNWPAETLCYVQGSSRASSPPRARGPQRPRWTSSCTTR